MISILVTIFLLLLFHYIIFLSKINKGLNKIDRGESDKLPDEFVSVIIPFRNESENILTSVKSLTAQYYPQDKFEVIYVNDLSSDDSYDKIRNFEKPKNIKILSVSDKTQSRAYKKRAINIGISHSQGEIIVTTDADCKHNPNWLRKLLSGFDSQTGFISGPVSFSSSKDIFSKLQALEFAGLVLAGAGLIGGGSPTICNGANLAFRKSVFKKLNGYQDQLHLSSGEDELLMQKIAAQTKYKVKFCWEKHAVVHTDPSQNLNSFVQQRKRWASKGLFYKNKLLITRLVLIYFFYLSLFVQITLALTVSKLFFLTLCFAFVVKMGLELTILKKGAEFLFPRDLFRYCIIAEIFQPLYITLSGMLGVFGNFRWKDRKLTR